MHAKAECLRGHSVAGSWGLGGSQPIGLYRVSFSFSHFLQLSESSRLCRFSGFISNLWSMRPALSHSSQILGFQIIFEILLVSLFISTFLFIFICILMSLENYWLKTNWVTDSSSAIGNRSITYTWLKRLSNPQAFRACAHDAHSRAFYSRAYPNYVEPGCDRTQPIFVDSGALSLEREAESSKCCWMYHSEWFPRGPVSQSQPSLLTTIG